MNEKPFDLGPDYELVRHLASGGMGSVWLARQRRLGREVVVKRIHPHLLAKTEHDVLGMFRAEAEVVAKLRHENIVQVFDVLAGPDGAPFVVMEYVEGCDASRLLAQHGPVPAPVVAYLLVQVATALADAHEPDPNAGRPSLIHRDIKPANILVAINGAVKLTDFGIAKIVDQTDGIAHTAGFKGSLPYAAPEQLEPDAPFDRRVDLYALGVSAFELLTAFRPYEDESISPIGGRDRLSWMLSNVMARRRRTLAEIHPDAPSEAAPLFELVESLLAPVNERIPDANALVDGLADAGFGGVRDRRTLAHLVQAVRPIGPRTIRDLTAMPPQEAPRAESDSSPSDSDPMRSVGLEPASPHGGPAPTLRLEAGALPTAITGPTDIGATVPSATPVAGARISATEPAPSSPEGPAARSTGALRLSVIVLALVAAGLGALAVTLGTMGLGDRDGTVATAADEPAADEPAAREAADEPGAAEPSGEDTAEPDPSSRAEQASDIEPAPEALGEPSGDPAFATGEAPEPSAGATTPELPVADEPEARTEDAPAAADPPASADPPAASPCTLRVIVSPGGTIAVNGASRGRAPQTLRVPPGRHRISAESHGEQRSRIVRCRDGEPHQVMLDFL